MTKQDYIELINKSGKFSESEFIIRQGTDITDLDYDTVGELISFRKYTNKSTLITSAFRPGDDGAHGKGLAFDLILFDKWKDKAVDPNELWLLATTYPWNGVGIYFDWSFVNNSGRRVPCVGIHVDKLTGNNRPLRWLRITKKVDGKDERLYYYQSTKTGLFFNSKMNESLRLEDAINLRRSD